MSILIKCPRLGIEPSAPQDFALLLEFADINKHERMDLAILSCMMALGGSAHASFSEIQNACRMSSAVGTLVLYVEDGRIKIREEENPHE